MQPQAATETLAADIRHSLSAKIFTSYNSTEPPWCIDPSEDLILSDVHIGKTTSYAQACTTFFQFSCPRAQLSHANTLAKHTQNETQPSQRFALPSQPECFGSLQLDSEGDVVLKRRRCELHEPAISAEMPLGQTADQESWCTSCGQCHRITIHHAMATTLDHVGKQVWRGATLLADFMLSQHQHVRKRCVVDLGAGTGLAGIAAACAASHVLLTDLPAMLPLCQSNVQANASLLSQSRPAHEMVAHVHPTPAVQQQARDSCRGAEVDVLQLDWSDMPPLSGCSCLLVATEGTESNSAVLKATEWAQAHNWTLSQLCRLQHAQVFLAADCIYDNALTAALMNAAAELLIPCMCTPRDRKIMYMALEKRWNFTLKDMDSRAVAYDYWRTLFRETKLASADEQAETLFQLEGPHKYLAGVQLDVDGIRRMLHSERGCDLELWQLFLRGGV